MVLDQLTEVFKDTLAIIRYHTWWPGSGDPYYQYNIPENTARINYYGVNSVPRLKIDGNITGGSIGYWSAQISNEIIVTAPLEIDISGEFSNANRNGNLDITVIATDVISYSNLRLRIAITESNIFWHAPNNTDWHHQTFRDMLPHTSGISFSISNGDTLTFDQNFSLPIQLKKYNCEVVVFVQSDNGRRILQGARESIMAFQPLYELVHFDLLTPPNGDTVHTCFPSFEWEASYDPDSGFAVNYLVEMDLSPSFSDPILSDTLSDTAWVSPQCLMNDTTYYWRV
ncbi:MAG: Omp28-related outer membrane protein, partial [Candidatus Zixiibacteriota bacterium]